MGSGSRREYEEKLKLEHFHERREALMEEAPAALREKLQWIQTWFDEDWRRNILSRYELALRVSEIYDDVTDNNGGRYGSGAVEVIKTCFRWDDGVIYQALRLVEAFIGSEESNARSAC